jgi:hypothetical protein
LLPDSCAFEVEIAVAKLKNSKFPGSDEITAVLIEAGETLRCEVSELPNSVWNKKELHDQRKQNPLP